MSFQSGRIAGPVMLIAAFLSTVHPNIKLDTELLFFWAKWPPPRIKVTVNLGPPSPHLSWYQRTTNKYLLQISRARPRHCTSTSNTPTKCKVDRTNIKKKHTYEQTYRQLQPSQRFLKLWRQLKCDTDMSFCCGTDSNPCMVEIYSSHFCPHTVICELFCESPAACTEEMYRKVRGWLLH